MFIERVLKDYSMFFHYRLKEGLIKIIQNYLNIFIYIRKKDLRKKRNRKTERKNQRKIERQSKDKKSIPTLHPLFYIIYVVYSIVLLNTKGKLICLI